MTDVSTIVSLITLASKNWNCDNDVYDESPISLNCITWAAIKSELVSIPDIDKILLLNEIGYIQVLVPTTRRHWKFKLKLNMHLV